MSLLRDLGAGLLAGVVAWVVQLSLAAVGRFLLTLGWVPSVGPFEGEARVQVVVFVSILLGFGIGGLLCGRLALRPSYRPALLMFSMNVFGPGIVAYRGLIARSVDAGFSPAEAGLLVGVATATIAGVWIGWRLRSRSAVISTPGDA